MQLWLGALEHLAAHPELLDRDYPELLRNSQLVSNKVKLCSLRPFLALAVATYHVAVGGPHAQSERAALVEGWREVGIHLDGLHRAPPL